MGAMIPFFAGRIAQGWGNEMGTRTSAADPDLLQVALKHSARGRVAAISCARPVFDEGTLLV
jgi:hypothetical protein